jgi:hypothetical protein
MLEKYPKLKAESPNPFDAANCTLEADVQEALSFRRSRRLLSASVLFQNFLVTSIGL